MFLDRQAFASNTVSRHSSARVWQSRSKQLVVLLCCLSASGYFAYHALHGRYGFEARNRLIERSSVLEFEIKSLEAVRSLLARDVALLAADPPAPDLVEEIARELLGFSYPSDKIIRR